MNAGGHEVSQVSRRMGQCLGWQDLTKVRSRCLQEVRWIGPRADSKSLAMAAVASRPSEISVRVSLIQVISPWELSQHPLKSPNPTWPSTR